MKKEKPSIVRCAGAEQTPLRRCLVLHGGYITVHGECPVCGHLYNVTGNAVLQRHTGDQCSPGIFRRDCKHRGRAPQYTWEVLVEDWRGPTMLSEKQLDALHRRYLRPDDEVPRPYTCVRDVPVTVIERPPRLGYSGPLKALVLRERKGLA